VLVVDDQAESGDVVVEYLGLAGYRVLTATDGGSALRILAQHRVDLVLMDIQIPGQDGFSTFADLRKNREWADLPVIFLSSFDRPNLKVKALEMGAEDYITKPFNRAELMARIRAVLRRSSRYLEIERNMQGNLESMPLPALLQTLSLGAKTATVHLHDPESLIWLRDGHFVGAQYGSFTGQEALLRLMFGAVGKFSIRFDLCDPEPEVAPMQVDSLLLTFAPTIDETHANLSTVTDRAQLETRLRIVDDDTEMPSLRQWIMQQQKPIDLAANYLRESIQQGKLVPV
jgi:CheY-like chemotaxis protein